MTGVEQQDALAEAAALQARAAAVRRRALSLIGEARYGFIGSCFSCLDLLVCLGWARHTRCLAAAEEAGSNFVLSKGHAAAALYAAFMEDEGAAQDCRYAAFSSPLQAHPNSRLHPRVTVSSGSLGQAVAVAAGLALAERLLGRTTATYVLVGDGELQAGAVWEALMAAARQEPPPRLTVVVDANGFQSTGRVARPEAAREMLRALAGVYVELDGHDVTQVLAGLERCAAFDGMGVIWARTRRGAGLPGFDEELPMSSLPGAEQMATWLKALGG